MIHSSKSNSSVDCEFEGGICACPNHSINIISSNNNEVFFDMVEHIEDLDYNKKYLISLKHIILNQ